MPGYWTSKGTYVEGHRIGSTGGVETDRINCEVEAAVARCRDNGASAGKELRVLFGRHPQLREDRWEMGMHPLSPMIEWFVKESLG